MRARVRMIKGAKPLVGVILLNTAFAGMDVISMAALKHGMSSFVYLVYANLIATALIAPLAAIFDRNLKQKRMTFSVFNKILLLSILESVNGNLYFMGMKHTSATFAAAMGNALPAISFLIAWIFKLEKVRISNVWSQVKVVGTITTVVGAMVMSLTKGPIVPLAWTKSENNNDAGIDEIVVSHRNSIAGALMIAAAYFLWASFINFQAIVLDDYPAELSLTAWISLLSTVECAVIALVMQRQSPSAWLVKWDIDSFAAVYNGVVCVGVGYYIQATITKCKGPVYVTAFSPLTSVMVAIIASIVLSEQMFLGRVVGAIIIVGGLYLVLWGKSKDDVSSLASSPSSCSISSRECDGPEKVQVNSNRNANGATNGDVTIILKQ